jgi:hypothetical protein
MAVEAVGAVDAGRTTARTEFERIQQQLAEDLAAKAAEKVAARDKEAVIAAETEALVQRQDSATPAADIGRTGTTLDLVL